jgi:hypothetical protein
MDEAGKMKADGHVTGGKNLIGHFQKVAPTLESSGLEPS